MTTVTQSSSVLISRENTREIRLERDEGSSLTTLYGRSPSGWSEIARIHSTDLLSLAIFAMTGQLVSDRIQDGVSIYRVSQALGDILSDYKMTANKIDDALKKENEQWPNDRSKERPNDPAPLPGRKPDMP